MVSLGAQKTVMNLIHTHKSNDLKHTAMSCIMFSSMRPRQAITMFKAGLLPDMINVFKIPGVSQELTESTTKALEYMAVADNKIRVKIVELGTVQTIISTLNLKSQNVSAPFINNTLR